MKIGLLEASELFLKGFTITITTSNDPKGIEWTNNDEPDLGSLVHKWYCIERDSSVEFHVGSQSQSIYKTL